jgi:hypothetical protein
VTEDVKTETPVVRQGIPLPKGIDKYDEPHEVLRLWMARDGLGQHIMASLDTKQYTNVRDWAAPLVEIIEHLAKIYAERAGANPDDTILTILKAILEGIILPRVAQDAVKGEIENKLREAFKDVEDPSQLSNDEIKARLEAAVGPHGVVVNPDDDAETIQQKLREKLEAEGEGDEALKGVKPAGNA